MKIDNTILSCRLIYFCQSNPGGIAGLQIPRSRMPGLRKGIRDGNPYLRGNLIRYKELFVLCNLLTFFAYCLLAVHLLLNLESRNIRFVHSIVQQLSLK